MFKHSKIKSNGLGKKSIKEKLLRPTLKTLVAGMIILAVSTITMMYSQINNQITKSSEEMCMNYANKLTATMDAALLSTKTMASMIESSIKTKKTDRELLEKQLIEVLSKRSEFLSGFALFELNGYDNLDN